MKVRNTIRVCTTLFAAILAIAISLPADAQPQEKDHAVSAAQLRQDTQKAAATRQANEVSVRAMFRTDAAKEALKSAGIDYRQVDQAISQVDDEDLGRMAQRSREVEKDFAAGNLGDRDLLIILLVAVALILVIVAVR
jgi:hypothetical protein